MDAGRHEDLDAWLDAVAGRFEVERTLRETAGGRTEVVWRHVGERRIGPFVRKTFDARSGRGGAYLSVWEAQARGTHLTHQPLVFDCAQEGDTFEVIMGYVEGETLRDLVARVGASPELARQVMGGLCDAAGELHDLDARLIHRDIKPSNVMVSGEAVTLIDLGIARAWREGARRDTERLGTPGYAPPEQFGYGQTSVRTDVYALGMTCAFCLTGKDPTAELRESGFRDPRIPEDLRGVLAHACAFDPDERHASAAELKADIERALGASPDTPEPQGPSGHRDTWGRVRNVAVTIFVILMLLGAISATLRPTDRLKDVPSALVFVMYFLFAPLPAALIGYLVFDKRRLRPQMGRLASATWRQELPVCLGLALLSVALSFVLYALVAAP